MQNLIYTRKQHPHIPRSTHTFGEESTEHAQYIVFAGNRIGHSSAPLRPHQRKQTDTHRNQQAAVPKHSRPF